MKKLLFLVSSRFSHKFGAAHLRFYCDRPTPSLSKHPGPLAYYKSLVNQGKLKHDSYQEKIAFQLENVLGRLDQYDKDMEEYHVNLAKWEENRENERRRLLLEEAKTKQGGASPSVSKRRNFLNKWMSRKTMLMDMFYGATKGIVQHRKRLHFHEDGMQKEIFKDLLVRMEEHCEYVLIGSEIDYCHHIAQSSVDQNHYFWPVDSTNTMEYESMWNKIVGESGGKVTSRTLPVMFGRY